MRKCGIFANAEHTKVMGKCGFTAFELIMGKMLIMEHTKIMGKCVITKMLIMEHTKIMGKCGKNAFAE